MGADFFARLARDYARAHPPEHGRLLEYGFDLPGFVAGYEAAAGRYPWFADVGRLELAWHRAYIARSRRRRSGRKSSRGVPPLPDGRSRARAASLLPAARLPRIRSRTCGASPSGTRSLKDPSR